jgi:flagellar FliJ protein
MKRFRFRLQRVLDVRDRVRDEARQELVAKNAARDEAVRVLGDLQAELLRERLQEGGTYSASDLLLMRDFQERLAEAIEQQQVLVQKAEAEAEQAREAYVAASKDVKSIEKLKEKRIEEYTEAVLKEEGAELDELTVQRHGKDKGSR